MYARRLQLQEQMTREIADCISDVVGAKGVAVAVEAAHLCAMMRGVNKSDVRMTTWSFTGVFREDQALREEVKRAPAIEAARDGPGSEQIERKEGYRLFALFDFKLSC